MEALAWRWGCVTYVTILASVIKQNLFNLCSTEKANSHDEVASFVSVELQELRRSDDIVHGRGIARIRYVVYPTAQRKPVSV